MNRLPSQIHMLALVGIVLLAAAFGGGCASGRETQNLMATLPVAGTAGSAHRLAVCIVQDLDTQPGVPEADKADLRARADVLKAHAEKLASALDRYDPKGLKNPSITLGNLRARGDALEEEYRTAFREWGYWQVRHGLREPGEVFEVFDYSEALGE